MMHWGPNGDGTHRPFCSIVMGEALTCTCLAPPPIMYLLWSNKHKMWWRPNAIGYTSDVAEAGHYTETKAIEHVVKSSHCGLLDQVTCMVATHHDWESK